MDDDDRVWLTYDQAAEMLDVKADSVRRRAAARKWPRRPGNDRKVKVGVPRDAIPPKPPEKSGDDDGGARIPAHTPDDAGIISLELSEAKASIARLEGVVDGLRQQADDLRADRDRWHELATTPRPSWLQRIRSSLTQQ